MTSEVIVMNKHAMVLAADSATTVRQFIEGEFKERYYKGANKLFELSAHNPVGLMLYDSSTVDGVPWEIIAKTYRRELRDKTFDTLQEYASALFEFITTHNELFPHEQRAVELADYVSTVALIRCLSAFQEDSGVQSAADAATDDDASASITSALNLYIESALQSVSVQDLPDHFSHDDPDKAIEKHSEQLLHEIKEGLGQLSNAKDFNVDTLDLEKLMRLSVYDLFKNYQKYLSKTGVLVCGYGDKEYFPGYIEYHCYGLLLNRFIVDECKSKRISLTNISDVRAFAQSSAVYTFMLGFGEDVYQAEKNLIRESLNLLASKIASQLDIDEIENLNEHIQAVSSQHIDELFRICMRDNHAPLHRVVGSLPVEEMTELAETLIHLESLKEKVTKTSEMVGGPIDVAAIGKSDGFIWIKRKHYFDPELNRRFFLRQDKEYQL